MYKCMYEYTDIFINMYKYDNQLHAEIDEFDVLRQVQALRSLAKISTHTPSQNLPVVPVPGAGVGGDDKGDRDREKEREMR